MAKKIMAKCSMCQKEMRKDNIKGHKKSCRISKCIFCDKNIKSTKILNHVKQSHPKSSLYLQKRYHQWLRNRNHDTEDAQNFYPNSQVAKTYQNRYKKKYYWRNPQNGKKYDLGTAKIAFMKAYQQDPTTPYFQKQIKDSIMYLYYDVTNKKWSQYRKRLSKPTNQK